MFEYIDSKKLTSSGSIFTGNGIILGFLLGTDGINDPLITIYDGTDNSGEEKIPSTTYDASALGLNGAMLGFKMNCKIGCYVEITCAGAVEVIVYYRQSGYQLV